MAQVTITINSREYAIACDDGQEAHILKLAKMLDNNAKQLTANGSHINENMLLAMSGLLLADELLEARKGQAVAPAPVAAAPARPIEPEVKIVEKIVEKEADLTSIDTQLAEALKDVLEHIKTVANQINLL